jgi:uncharacterized membrane protein
MEQMEQMNQVEPTDEVEEGEEHIHLPPPSWAPIILALGLTGVCFGVVLSPVLLAIGVVLLLVGLGMWVYEDIKNASQMDAEDHASQSAS